MGSPPWAEAAATGGASWVGRRAWCQGQMQALRGDGDLSLVEFLVRAAQPPAGPPPHAALRPRSNDWCCCSFLITDSCISYHQISRFQLITSGITHNTHTCV